MPRDRGRRASGTHRRRYSKDILGVVIYQYYVLDHGTEEISRNLRIPRRVVQRALKTFKDTGEPCNTKKRTEYYHKLTPEELDYLLELVESQPDLYLDELCNAIASQSNKKVHLTTVWRREPPDWIVFLDKTHIDTRTTYRLNGWGRRGQRVPVSHNWVRGKRWSLLPAISLDGLVYTEAREGAFDGDAFVAYIKSLLRIMKPYPGVKAMCATRGVKLIYLTPYSPDFNPIETGFSTFKAHGRHDGEAFRATLDSEDELDTISYFNRVLDRVFTPDNICGWFRKAGYF
ncbi:hypothetical protein EXIGLDRAFT_705021 [Exidia glandulosa HHB12029]|uniref:Uncharacterized protein n=1 Tax=Exidia glandulosa HHB12029 TaxID=1314781 RepID=A0A165BG65_EXIGL|nr:hypothetical protein EXIGLDRAFT_705021 [Exidia glandulosa HHB12029]